MNEIASSGQLRMSLVRWILVCVPAITALGSLIDIIAQAGPANRWFAALVPQGALLPAWAFTSIWIILYAMIGVGLAMVICARGAPRRTSAIALFLVGFIALCTWKVMFFGQHQVSSALVLMGFVLGLAAAASIMFARIRVGAAMLMLPYLAWLCFAATFNFQIDARYPDAETLAVPAASANIGGGQEANQY
ncbi:MAG: TspO/MBR family protein [Pseudomonadota bacterium]